MKFKVLLFKEWKESPTYKIEKWFVDRKIQIEKWFEQELPDFELDYFEWADTQSISDFFTASLYFSEPDIEYRLDFIINADKVEDGNIDEIALQMTGFSRENSEPLGTLNKSATLDQLVPNLILELVSEFKTENIDDDGNRIVKNELPGPPNDQENDEESTDQTDEQQPEEPTGEVEEQPEPEA